MESWTHVRKEVRPNYFQKLRKSDLWIRCKFPVCRTQSSFRGFLAADFRFFGLLSKQDLALCPKMGKLAAFPLARFCDLSLN